MKYLSYILFFLLAGSQVAVAQTAAISATDDYSEREVQLRTPTGDLFGTLVIPIENKLGIVVLIIPGSGPTDRDGNSTLIQGKNNSLKMLAEGLAKEGISSLRIDKRGIGKSKNAIVSESDMRFEDMVEDAVGWIRFLKIDKRFKKFGIIGHSEGSLVGMLAADITEAPYYVSIAGVGSPADEVLKSQLAKQLTPQMMDTVNRYLGELKEGRELSNPNPAFAMIFRSSVQPYLISWIKYNPSEEIARLKAKVLLVQGTTDIQVSLDELEHLKKACPKAKSITIEGMNHIMKHVTGNVQENAKSYGNPDLPLADGLVRDIADFLKQ